MIIGLVLGAILLVFVIVYGRRLVEIVRCRHEFRWMEVDGYALDQLVCVKCGIPYHWEAWH